MTQHLTKKNNQGYLPNLELNVQVLSGIKTKSRAPVSKNKHCPAYSKLNGKMYLDDKFKFVN